MAKRKHRSLKQLLGDLRRHAVAREAIRLRELSGFAYRFTIFFPLVSGATDQGIFSRRETIELGEFLSEFFDGCSTEASNDKPPLTGLWRSGPNSKLVVDGHTRIVVYAARVFPALEARA